MASPVVLPHSFVAIRLPPGTHKVVKVSPDTTIALGKYGTFHANHLLGRPHYVTYEVIEQSEDRSSSGLRVVSAAELHGEILAESVMTESGSTSDGHGSSYDVVGDNRMIFDDATRQALTMEEIEQLKKADTGSGKDIIAKIMQSHSALDQKTVFSLSKYALRKRQKYLKRFTVFPLDVSILTQWMLEEREPAKIMEVREEVLGLLASWSNVHYGGLDVGLEHDQPNGRWLVVDDTAGLVVAQMAERMGILHPSQESLMEQAEQVMERVHSETHESHDAENDIHTTIPHDGAIKRNSQVPQPLRKKPRRHPPDAMSATSNTITLLHPATQPNMSMLSYFSYDPSDTGSRNAAVQASDHPLHVHLKTLNFLQLTQPELDGSYQEPESFPEEVVATWKSSQRGNYYRKRRRWERVKRVVDETRAGGFDGLVVASTMDPATVLHYAVPLLKGGGQVVVYSPSIEPVAELADLYSSARRSAYLSLISEHEDGLASVSSTDFPVDPRLLLAPTVQTARARTWQVLPGRTHPLMTSRGGAEGYLFTATRVLPAAGKVQARGNFAKKRKAAEAPEDQPDFKAIKAEEGLGSSS